MSSLTRTLQKRIMKASGLSRQTQKVEVRGGVPTLVEIPRGRRPIVNTLGDVIGMRWPTRFAVPTNPDAKDLVARIKRDKAHGRIAA